MLISNPPYPYKIVFLSERAVATPAGSSITIRTGVPSAERYVTWDAVTAGGSATEPGDVAHVSSAPVAASYRSTTGGVV